MPDTQMTKNTQIECALPKFKDKVMYVVSPKGVEQSYTVSSSFKGILRLSPNDNTSVNEVSEIFQLPEELYEMDTHYSDAIVFEGGASIKSLASIERRMIIASDSDSYAVDLRISDTGVEFDNLNVVGISKFEHLTLFTNDENEYGSFKMGNSFLKSKYNDKAYKIDGSDYDVKDIDIKNGDESFILSGDIKDGNRIFKFSKTKTFIEELVMEALLDLETVPTGSIHFVPLTMKQYKLLINGGTNGISSRPNCYTEETDPIVRDFLLCDGRKYNRRDFPELAKMLWNEKVTFWRPSEYTPEFKNANGSVEKYEGEDGPKLIVKEEHKNEYGYEDDDITFRVPDLRRMFISYIKAEGIDGYMEDATSLDNESATTGKWLPDNVPMSTDGNTDNHFHFIAYGSYTPIVSFPQPDSNRDYTFVKGDEEQFTEVAKDVYMSGGPDGSNIYCGVTTTGQPAVLTLTNHLSWSKSPKKGPGFGTGTGGLRRRDYWGYEPWPAIAYMAGPRTKEKDNSRDYIYSAPSVARTSLSISNYIEADTNEDAYGTDKNNVLNNEKYQELDKQIYGHENTPKYVACLPLIKI